MQTNMNNRLSKIRKDSPDLADREEVKGVAADIDIYAALSGLASSEAGQILIAAITSDIAATVNAIVAGYKTLPEIELRALGAKLEARLSIVQSLSRSRTNLDFAEAYLAELTS
jgi:hypothetical protein